MEFHESQPMDASPRLVEVNNLAHWDIFETSASMIDSSVKTTVTWGLNLRVRVLSVKRCKEKNHRTALHYFNMRAIILLSKGVQWGNKGIQSLWGRGEEDRNRTLPQALLTVSQNRKRPNQLESCFRFLQSSSLQNGGGAFTCAEVLSLLSLQERNVGNKEHVQLVHPGYVWPLWWRQWYYNSVQRNAREGTTETFYILQKVL